MSKDNVACHSSHTYAEQPTAFQWNDQHYTISLIENERHLPGEKQFAVRTSEDLLFELTYSIIEDSWQINPR